MLWTSISFHSIDQRLLLILLMHQYFTYAYFLSRYVYSLLGLYFFYRGSSSLGVYNILSPEQYFFMYARILLVYTPYLKKYSFNTRILIIFDVIRGHIAHFSGILSYLRVFISLLGRGEPQFN